MDKTAVDKLKQLLAEAPKRAIQIDDRLFIFIATDAKAEAAIKRGLAQGKTIIENGVSRWVEWYPVRLPGQTGSAAYVWKGGNHVKAEKLLFTKDATGNVKRESLGFAWREAQEVM